MRKRAGRQRQIPSAEHFLQADDVMLLPGEDPTEQPHPSPDRTFEERVESQQPHGLNSHRTHLHPRRHDSADPKTPSARPPPDAIMAR
ncbi:hypothetical protein GCM10027589_16770 [Actinocorallia lasiicapitis]